MREFARLQSFLGYQTRASFYKGRRRESRFWNAFNKYKKLTARDAPQWYAGMRKATPEEDLNGADFFIKTNIEGIPEIPVNVKSSVVSIDEFMEKQRTKKTSGKTVLIQVGNSLDHFQCIRTRTFNAIEKKFSTRLAA